VEQGEARRAVITGMGAITPLGSSVGKFWQGCVQGRSGIDWIRLGDPHAYPVKIDGEVRDFDPLRFMDRREARRMARFAQFAVACAAEAIDDARLRLEDEDPARVGVLLGTGYLSLWENEDAVKALMGPGIRRVDPRLASRVMSNMAATQVARTFGAKGYNNTVATACAAGTQAIGGALDLIRLGRADVVIAGGTEANLSEVGLAGFVAMRALSTHTDDPKRASRPFDADRDGFVCSEGAAALIVESLAHARQRGARVYAELAGYGASADAHHIVQPADAGEGAQRAMRLALQDAGISREEVDYINAHGTSTQTNDAVETTAIKAVFGEHAYRLPVSSTKSMIGHALGAAGAIESVACLKAIETSILPPTINYERPDPACDLDYVPNEARRVDDLRVVLKNSFGFGGQNACLVFKRFEG
jgi:3-oxoacyl-[acyl-carrier-protein] synthase II